MFLRLLNATRIVVVTLAIAISIATATQVSFGQTGEANCADTCCEVNGQACITTGTCNTCSNTTCSRANGVRTCNPN